LVVESRASLTPEELEDGVKIVVVLPPDPGLLELAAAAPETQFLAFGFPELEPAHNLSLAVADGAAADQTAFLAGYIAALITPDWRVGVISPAGQPGEATVLGFGNGVRYYCGLCRPAFPPFPDAGYPLFAELADGAGEADWQAVVGLFQPWSVQTVYVAPEVASEGLLQALAGAGFNLMGAGPAPAGLAEHWIATIGGGDPLQSVREAWPGLLAGAEGQRLTAALSLEEINEDLLSPGRQRLVEEMMAGLAAGYIDTGIEGQPAD
jgi:hypothetical protein